MTTLSINTSDSPVVIFDSNKALADMLCDLKVQGRHPLTIESTKSAKSQHNKNSRCWKTDRANAMAFADCFKGEIFITKREYVSLQLDYEKQVKAAYIAMGETEKAEQFESGALPYGEWYGNANTIIDASMTKASAGKENFQLRYIKGKNANYRYSQYTYHYADGTELTAEELDLYNREFKKETAPRLVLVHNEKLEALNRLVVNGTVYVRKGNESQVDIDSLRNWIAKATAEVQRKLSEELGEVA